jgi:hypothetical protein
MFYGRLLIIGSVYLLAFPIVYAIAEGLVVPYYRHRVITIATLLIQHIAIVFLSFVFTSKRTLYRQAVKKTQNIL